MSRARSRFVILAVPRSGSNMLCSMLDSHELILCHHELFNPKGIRLALRLRSTENAVGSMEERDRDPLRFLQQMYGANPEYPCIGFKLTHRQNPAVFRSVLHDPAIAKIILRRRNRLKTYVSSLIAERLGQWEVYHSEDLAAERPLVRIGPQQFLERVAFDADYYAEIDAALLADGNCGITVDYEDLPTIECQNRILQFLGLLAIKSGLTARSVKQNPTDLRQLIENYDELAWQFAGSEFEAELHSCVV